MAHILETDRLILREFEEEDAQDLFHLNADPAVIRYTGDPPFESIEQAWEFLVKYKDYEQHGMGRWAILDKVHNEFLGWCGLKNHPGQFVDLGYRLFKKYWGKGYATEAATASLDYGFSNLNLEEIVGRVAQENTGSIRVLEKVGMTFWKTGSCHGIDEVSYYRILRKQKNG